MNLNFDLLTARDAAQRLGVSYPTIKKWIYDGKLESVKTPGGHHRLTLESLRPLMGKEIATLESEPRAMSRRISVKNQLEAKIVAIRLEGIMAEIVLTIGEGQITSMIPSEAVKDLQLNVGDTVTALLNPTDIMVRIPDITE